MGRFPYNGRRPNVPPANPDPGFSAARDVVWT